MRRPLITLRIRHRQSLWQMPLWIAATTLAIDIVVALNEGAREGRLAVVTTGFVLAIVSRWLSRRPLHRTAIVLDLSLSSANRFEALVESADRDDALAAALRQEAGAFLQTARLPRPYTWYAAWLLLVLGVIGEAAIGWHPPEPKPVSVPPAVATPAHRSADPPKPPEAPLASFKWMSPAPLIVVRTTEVVPLWAASESQTGLDRIELHFMRNGEELARTISLSPVPSGTQSVRYSLGLSELSLEPTDVLAYYLSAVRVRPDGTPPGPEWPMIYSPLQLMEIRPAIDPAEGLDAVDETTPALQVARELASGQAGLVPRIFAASHAAPSKSPADPATEIPSLAMAQKALADRAQQLVAQPPDASNAPERARSTVSQQLQSTFAPQEKKSASDLANATRQTLRSAAESLERAEPATALQPAQKALADLIALENSLRREAKERQAAARAGLAKPDTSTAPRDETPAGQLERLAQEQRILAEELSQGATLADGFSREDQTVRQLKAIVAAHGLDAAIEELVSQAIDSADEAANRLNENDQEAAKQPAARAAEQLREAVSKMEANGRQSAMDRLEAVQRALIHSAALVQDSAPNNRGAGEAKELTTRAVAALRDEAQRQLRKGSDAAAHELTRMSETIDKSKIESELDRIEKADSRAKPEERGAAAQTLVDLAQNAADARNALGDAEQLRKQALDELKRDKASLDSVEKSTPDRKAEFAEEAMADMQQAKSVTGKKSGSGEGSAERSLIKAVRAMVVKAHARVADEKSDGAALVESRDLVIKANSTLTSAAAATDAANMNHLVEEYWQIVDVIAETKVITDLKDLAKKPERVTAENRSMVVGKLQKIIDAIDQEMADGKKGESGKSGPGSGNNGGKEKAPAPSAASSAAKKEGPAQQKSSTGAPGTARGSGAAGGTTTKPFASRMLATLQMGQEMEGLISLLSDAGPSAARKQLLRVANPADAPPIYRTAVADYFEALSRDSTAR